VQAGVVDLVRFPLWFMVARGVDGSSFRCCCGAAGLENDGGIWCKFVNGVCGSGSWKRWCLLHEREVLLMQTWLQVLHKNGGSSVLMGAACFKLQKW